MRIVTNFARFPPRWLAANGLEGEAIAARSADEFRRQRGADVVWLVNCDPKLTLTLAAYKLWARDAAPLIAADLVLRAPVRWTGRVQLPIQRFLLSRVDFFIHYFRDLRGYERVFGIGPERSAFVPFKVNLVDRYVVETTAEGDYVLCLGRSMRDFDTFLDAIEQLPYPAAITQPRPDLMARHGARFTRPLDRLPKNVRILEDDGSDESMMRIVGGAKMVVIPVLRASLVASGISTALNAMSLGKCVIGSEGPGMSDVFTDGQALIVEPEDGPALAAVIRRAWEDSALRSRTAAAGYRYARETGGEPQLYQRVVDQVAGWYSARVQGRGMGA